MARRSMAGQLNMFDFFNMDAPASGEVEMVSLMPDFDEEEPEVESAPVVEPEPVVEPAPEPEPEPVAEPEPAPVIEKKPRKAKAEPKKVEPPEEEKPQTTRQKVSTSVGDDGKVVMSRTYEVAGEKMEIAYLNYNKVRITKGKKEPEIIVFESSKDAVDYYVEKMQELEIDE